MAKKKGEAIKFPLTYHFKLPTLGVDKDITFNSRAELESAYRQFKALSDAIDKSIKGEELGVTLTTAIVDGKLISLVEKELTKR